ncbi:hypothetical protein KUTeg_007843 [Tegillarca granosa]|uniref:CUB domain-containing protein n=1 Tax=Tegillarca granosa TaxID=220873 RepID=A0ABQ9FEC7_TEGGR|nr:hypothetical protein KUTeg_007843 [Tegillarca granosa]
MVHACDCVVYQSYGKSQGKFHSPNFPAYYSRNIDCILFTFIADVEEIIEITFIEFDLKWEGKYTGCGDYLRLYVNLNRAEINEHNNYDFELCGNISHMNQKTYYSSGRSLVMEFHSDSSHVNHTGFLGKFKFLDSRTFKTTGRKQTGAECTYTFQSRANHSRGIFFSPKYPQNYPRHLNCEYRFYGNDREKVKVKFSNIQLYNSDKLYNGTRKH